MNLEEILEDIGNSSREAFRRKHVVLSFEQYLAQLAVRPYSMTRHAAAYLRDLFEFHGTYDVPGISAELVRRFRLFDDPDGNGRGFVFGHEEVQNRIYDVLCEFVERGRCDRFVMLHGPNGSAKSSLIEAIRNALETYSLHDDGALYRFSWIFCESEAQGRVGFGVRDTEAALESLATVDESLVTSRIPDEMKDPPFFLLPKRRRREFFERALEDAPERERVKFRWHEFLLLGQLAPKNRTIYESLLRSYQGDWRRVLRHVRVERYFLSHRYRNGAVTIEPQGTIDAGARLLGHGSMAGLPAALQHETLLEATGDLVDANAGLVEYSDFFKRNMEANKYLLSTAERGTVNLQGMSVALNLVLFGTTNEKYLTAFKRDPGWTSFKGRFELIRVPYLREYKKEARIYERHLGVVANGRHIAPHTATCAALWAVCTRLKRPDPQHFDPPLSRIVSRLGPIQKARYYDHGELPKGLDDDEKKVLRAAASKLAKEYLLEEEEFEGYVDAAYEGRRGASAREVMTMLTEIAVDSRRDCITPVDLFEALPRLTADKSIYSFLRIPIDGDYHDIPKLIRLVRQDWLRQLVTEVQRASDIVPAAEFQRLFRDYMLHARAFGTKEKLRNAQTGQLDNPDQKLMGEVERHLGVTRDPAAFRSNLMTKVAAFRLSNPDKPIVYEELFADYFQALEASFFRERKDRIRALVDDALVVHAGGGREMVEERRSAARHLVRRLIADFGYSNSSVSIVLTDLVRHFDELEG